MERPRHLSVLTDAGVDARVHVCLGRVLQVEGDVGRRLALWAILHAWKSEQAWPLCDADYEKDSTMIRNQAELSVTIDK